MEIRSGVRVRITRRNPFGSTTPGDRCIQASVIDDRAALTRRGPDAPPPAAGEL